MNSSGNHWQQALDAVARRVLPAARAADVARVSAGASQEIWSFDAVTGERRLPLILRLAGAWNQENTLGALDLETEAEILRAAADHGVPVPTVRLVLESRDGLGRGYVMDRVPGETVPRRILRNDAYAGARAVLTGECAAVLAAIHAVPPSVLPGGVRAVSVTAQLEAQYAAYQRHSVPRPVFEYAFRWLHEHMPPEPRTPALVHGDFRNGNFVVDEHGLRAVLDWEIAHVGDPMEDLGWLCVNSWRFGHIDRPVGGFGDREGLYDAYEAASGVAVEPERVRYWEVFGTLRWGVICASMARAYQDGLDRSVERGAIGRRASEAALDLLRLLVPVHDSRQEAGDVTQEQPRADELLEGVIDFLTSEVVPATDDRLTFQARVAARTLEVVRREMLRRGGGAVQGEQGRLQALVERDGTYEDLVPELCSRIREGRIELSDPQLREFLWATTLDTLAVDQPEYPAYRRTLEELNKAGQS